MGHLAAPELHGFGRTALCPLSLFASNQPQLFHEPTGCTSSLKNSSFRRWKEGTISLIFFFTTLRIFKILSFTLLLCIKKDGWEGKKNPVFTFFSSLINCFYCLNLKSTRNMFPDSVQSTSSPKHRHLRQEDRKCSCGSVRRYFFFHCNRAPGRRSETERMLDSHGREIRGFRSEERNR